MGRWICKTIYRWRTHEVASPGWSADCRWPMVQQIYGSELRSTDIFALDKGDGKGQARWETLSKRVTEHVFHPPVVVLIVERPSSGEIFHTNQDGSTEYFPGSL